MGLYEYLGSRNVAAEIDSLTMGNQFYTLLMAAMRCADTYNLDKLGEVFPNIVEELRLRYNAPGGALNDDEMERVMALYNEREAE